MILYHGGVGIVLPPSMVWLSSCVTVWRTLAGRICLPPMAKSTVTISICWRYVLAGENVELTSSIGALN